MDKCPDCGAELYECAQDHVGGARWLHCRAFSTHNFPVPVTTSTKDD